MAPPRKPESLKSIQGTTRKDRVVRPEVDEPSNDSTIDMDTVLTTHPAAPSWLPNQHAKKEWHRLAPMLVGSKHLTLASLSSFGMLCALHGKLVQLWHAGETPPAVMLATYRSLINDFGLTPASQGKVKRVEPNPGEGQGAKQPEANPFSRNGRRAA